MCSAKAAITVKQNKIVNREGDIFSMQTYRRRKEKKDEHL